MGKFKKKKEFPILKKESIFKGRAIRLEKLLLKAPDGRLFDRELIQHPGAAVAIPVLPGEKFVLVYQHRIAAGGWLLEFPAGTLEAGEAPLACAKREIIEETGFQAKKWKKLVSFYPAPGISTEFMHIFLASDLVPAAITASCGSLARTRPGRRTIARRGRYSWATRF